MGDDDRGVRILQAVRQFRERLTVPGGLFVEPDIPPKKAGNARASCGIPDGERVLALLDCTVMGSAKNAVLFGATGIWYHNDFTAGDEKGPGRVSYEQLADLAVASDSPFVRLGDGHSLEVSGCRLAATEVAALVHHVQSAVNGDAVPPPMPPDPEHAGADVATAAPAPRKPESWPKRGSVAYRIGGFLMIVVGAVMLGLVLFGSDSTVNFSFKYGWLGYAVCSLLIVVGLVRLFTPRRG